MDGADSGHAVIVELRLLDIAPGVDYGERMLRQREMDRGLRHACAVDSLVHPETVADKKRFLQTRGGNLILLAHEGEYEVDQHQSVDDGVDPRHDGARHYFPVLPPGPGDELGDIDVDDQRPQQEQPRVAHQDNPEKEYERYNRKAYPARLPHTAQSLPE